MKHRNPGRKSSSPSDYVTGRRGGTSGKPEKRAAPSPAGARLRSSLARVTRRGGGAVPLMTRLAEASVFLPGALLCALAASLLVAPEHVVTLAAALLAALGGAAGFFGYRLLSGKRRLERLLRELEMKTEVASSGQGYDGFDGPDGVPDRKVLYH